MTASVLEPDPFDIRRALRAPELLATFNEIGVLSAADVHVAVRLAGLAGESSEIVMLAAALAVRGPRLGHVFVDLATTRDSATVDSDEPVDLSGLPWPSSETWAELVGASPLVSVGDDPSALLGRPLRLVGTRLYLDRYWREERQVAADLLMFSGACAKGVRVSLLAAGLARLFSGERDARQRMAAASAVLRRFAVVAGGPGTGKTTTVARIVALLAEQAGGAGLPEPLIALAAPTGKAAARLEESVHAEASFLSVDPAIRAQLLGLHASTLHRLLGWRPGSHSRFRHTRANRLPHDAVIVDETSMVSLSLMARLAEAVREDARLILIGDPGQLTSIEAGAVLGDIVGPATDGLVMTPPARALLARATGTSIAAVDPPAGVTVGDGIVVLGRVHRYGGGIGRVAEAIRRGDGDAVLEALVAAPEEVTWIPVDVGDAVSADSLGVIRAGVVAAAAAVVGAARAGAAPEALAALSAFRVLCAHRRGPYGVATWTARIEGWLSEAIDGFHPEEPSYVGRPLLVTENDYELRLYNGDVGVLVSSGGRTVAVFDRGGELVSLSPSRLGAVETVYAMTIHKSQGSQFGAAAVLLPAPTSRILTRELLYTAVTRARERLIVAGTEETVRAAVGWPVARASGLGVRLWGG